jgi:conserved repeat domain
MKRNSIRLLTAALLLASAQQAFAAAGTTAGVSIGNTASVNYKVGTVDQTQQTGTATFVVDRLLNVTVSQDGSTYTLVSPGATAQALKFTVTNNTNDQMDIGLVATNDADPYGGTDNFDVGTFTYYIDDGDSIFEPGVGPGLDGAAVTFLDERTPDQATGVWVVADIPADEADGHIAGVKLTATLHDSTAATATAGFEAPDAVDGAVATADTGVDVAGSVQNVFGLLGAVGFDSDAYKVAGATIAVAKIATVISDPLASANPKAVPGAVIEYCITVTNTGGTAALNVKIDDAIPANTAYVANSIKVYSACDYANAGASAEDDDVIDEATDETDGTSGSKDATGVHTQVSSLAAGNVTPQVTATMFHVTVN